jgi:hypothetical protein
MGRHSGSGDGTAGTDAGPAFKDLTPEDKGAEFDASTSDARGYAARNFGAGQSQGEQYDAARAEQREQQRGNQ